MLRLLIVKPVSLIIMLIFFFTGIQPVWANAGPTYWQGFPAGEVLTLDDSCPIEIKKENLFWDFTDSPPGHSISGKVTASYTMVNPTDRNLPVQMAFPFFDSLADFTPEEVIITADGEPIPCSLVLGDKVTGEPEHFAKLLQAIPVKPYEPENFSRNAVGTLYQLQVNPIVQEKFHFVVDILFDEKVTKILVNGFNSYEREGNRARLGTRIYDRTTLEILVLGEKPEFSFLTAIDSNQENIADLCTYEISSRKVELKDYLLHIIKDFHQVRLTAGKPYLSSVQPEELQLYNIYAAALDRIFSVQQGLAGSSDLREESYRQRVMFLVYRVDFPANSSRNVTVNYRASGTMDRRTTGKPVYTFSYLLNPAKEWNSFGDLIIEIVAPGEAPYIIDSTVEFQQLDSGYYRAELASLPDRDLVFSLYEKNRITWWDGVQRVFTGYFGYYLLYFFILLFVAAGIIAGGLILRKKLKRSRG